MLRKILIAGFLFALSAFGADAQTVICNSQSGFIKQKGNIPVGDGLIMANDCQSLIDGGAFINPSTFIEWTAPQAFLAGQGFYVGGVLTNGSNVVTGLNPGSANMSAGEVLVGFGIPLGTKIQSVDSNSQIHMTANATFTGGTGMVVGFGANNATLFVPSGTTGLFSEYLALQTYSASFLEVGRAMYFHGDLGYANRATAYKLGDTITMDCVVNVSANCYARNDVMNYSGPAPGSGYFGTGYEIDNNVASTVSWGVQSAFGTQNAGHSFVSVGAGSGPMTSLYWATMVGSGGTFAAYAFTGTGTASGGATIYDSSDAPNIIFATNAHTHSVGINFFGTVFSGPAIACPNNNCLAGSNSGASASLGIAKINASNVVELGYNNQSSGISDTMINRHFRSSNSSPPGSITGCGTGAALTSGSTDTAGQLTVGTSPTNSCSFNFGLAYTNAPFCVVVDQNSTTTPFSYVVNNVGVSIGNLGAAGAGGHVLNYLCIVQSGG
jgi:hypothetical protein